MQIVKGKYNEAKVFIDTTEPGLIEQIQKVLDNIVSKDQKIRIMPDCHVGSGICIGYTSTISDKIVPYFVGSDVGCGVIVQSLNETEVDLAKLDKIMHNIVPSGFNVNTTPHRFSSQIDITQLRCYNHLKNTHKLVLGIGSLGSGNHYCELNKSEDGRLYLVIHTGSRNLGKQIADYYQQKAYATMTNRETKKQALVTQLKSEGRTHDIATELAKMEIVQVEKAMAYCEGQLMEDYLHDMAIAQEYASLNRKAIADIIQCGMRWKVQSEFQTIHNYIDMNTKILRKGAVRAEKGEILIIPMNMSWGSVIAVGKGNPDWNNSCAHGGGRKMSRKKAKESVSMDDYRKSMEGIYTTCVNKNTIDESPMAYKDPLEVMEYLKDTVNIVNHIKPIYNFKAGGE